MSSKPVLDFAAGAWRGAGAGAGRGDRAALEQAGAHLLPDRAGGRVVAGLQHRRPRAGGCQHGQTLGRAVSNRTDFNVQFDIAMPCGQLARPAGFALSHHAHEIDLTALHHHLEGVGLQITGIDWREAERPGVVMRGDVLTQVFPAAAFDSTATSSSRAVMSSRSASNPLPAIFMRQRCRRRPADRCRRDCGRRPRGRRCGPGRPGNPAANSNRWAVLQSGHSRANRG